MLDSRQRRTTPTAGFSVVEIIVVVAIIAVLAATAIPITMAYLRTYAIKGAASLVASEIQAARAQAIKRNVNWGVVFVTATDQQFQFVFEDVPGSAIRVPIDVAVNSPGGPGPVRFLPPGVIFAPPTGGPDRGFRFNRFGAMCDPGSAINCPDLPAGFPSGPPYVEMDPVAGATIRLVQPSTGLTRIVSVAPGGRVSTQ